MRSLLNELTPSQQMFMLFFSILYGIMLNSVIGLGAFPLTRALTLGKSADGLEGEEEKKARNRFILSFVLLNISPFLYFAALFLLVRIFVELSLDLCLVPQILFIGTSSLSVFAFYNFFLGSILRGKSGSSFFYTKKALNLVKDKKGLHPSSKHYLRAGFIYLAIPWLCVFLGIACFPARLIFLAIWLLVPLGITYFVT